MIRHRSNKKSKNNNNNNSSNSGLRPQTTKYFVVLKTFRLKKHQKAAKDISVKFRSRNEVQKCIRLIYSAMV